MHSRGLKRCRHLRRQLWDRLLIFFIRAERRIRLAVRSWVKGRPRERKSAIHPPALISVDGVGQATSSVARCAFVIALAEELRQRGHVPHVWLRGSNTRQTRLFHQPKTIDSMRPDAFILSQHVPLWVCRHPENALTAAAYAGATVLILAERNDALDPPPQFCVTVMDDGVEAVSPSFWNTYRSVLAKSDALVLIEDLRNTRGMSDSLLPFQSSLWRIPWLLEYAAHAPAPVKSEQPIVAFTGLNDSGVFFRELIKAQIALREFLPLSYEGRRAERTVQALFKKEQGGSLLTTAMDVPFLPSKLQKKVRPLSLFVEIPPSLIDKILTACGSATAASAVA